MNSVYFILLYFEEFAVRKIFGLLFVLLLGNNVCVLAMEKGEGVEIGLEKLTDVFCFFAKEWKKEESLKEAFSLNNEVFLAPNFLRSFVGCIDFYLEQNDGSALMKKLKGVVYQAWKAERFWFFRNFIQHLSFYASSRDRDVKLFEKRVLKFLQKVEKLMTYKWCGEWDKT